VPPTGGDMFGKDKKRAARPPQSGNEAELDDEVSGRGGEGTRNAEVTPKIGSNASPGQTSHPAPPGDVGIPADEELGEEKPESR
jgi:hypothetical protein